MQWLGAIGAGATLAGLAGCGGDDGNGDGGGPPKVLIDSDYNTMSDDGQLGTMAAQLLAQGTIDVLGITVVSGNQWLMQGVADALKSVERMGVDARVGVYAGANTPLSHDYATVQAELAQYPSGDGYLGAWSTPEPHSQADLTAPPDGFVTRAQVQATGAVDFIVDSIRKWPHEVTILAIGPLTNLALAFRQAPDIVPLVKRIIYMGGAIDVPGNTTATAEFNMWFDPQAAREVLRQPIAQVLVPLDVTDTVILTQPIYDRIAHDPAKQTVVTQIFRQLNGYGFSGTDGFENDPNYTQDIWDTLTIAYLVDPTLATQTTTRYVDVVTDFGPDDGRTVGTVDNPGGLQPITVVQRFDNARFFDLYVDLLTRPVPVRLPG
ncbi:MAG: nucleoside hydrolase [Burkholderiaceae bacterium]